MSNYFCHLFLLAEFYFDSIFVVFFELRRLRLKSAACPLKRGWTPLIRVEEKLSPTAAALSCRRSFVACGSCESSVKNTSVLR